MSLPEEIEETIPSQADLFRSIGERPKGIEAEELERSIEDISEDISEDMTEDITRVIPLQTEVKLSRSAVL